MSIKHLRNLYDTLHPIPSQFTDSGLSRGLPSYFLRPPLVEQREVLLNYVRQRDVASRARELEVARQLYHNYLPLGGRARIARQRIILDSFRLFLASAAPGRFVPDRFAKRFVIDEVSPRLQTFWDVFAEIEGYTFTFLELYCDKPSMAAAPGALPGN